MLTIILPPLFLFELILAVAIVVAIMFCVVKPLYTPSKKFVFFFVLAYIKFCLIIFKKLPYKFEKQINENSYLGRVSLEALSAQNKTINKGIKSNFNPKDKKQTINSVITAYKQDVIKLSSFINHYDFLKILLECDHRNMKANPIDASIIFDYLNKKYPSKYAGAPFSKNREYIEYKFQTLIEVLIEEGCIYKLNGMDFLKKGKSYLYIENNKHKYEPDLKSRMKELVNILKS